VSIGWILANAQPGVKERVVMGSDEALRTRMSNSMMDASGRICWSALREEVRPMYGKRKEDHSRPLGAVPYDGIPLYVHASGIGKVRAHKRYHARDLERLSVIEQVDVSERGESKG
jgi:hypothetical protein